MFSLPPVALCRSKTLGADVLFVQDEHTPIPRQYATLPVYTWPELEELLRIEMTPGELPAIHKLKLLTGGSIGTRSLQPSTAACPACGSQAVEKGKCGWCGVSSHPMPVNQPQPPQKTTTHPAAKAEGK